MTLDDRLKKAVDILGDRPREELTRELRTVTSFADAAADAELPAFPLAEVSAA
jgi:hypothetical protein